MVWSFPNSAGYEHAGPRPELHQGTPRKEPGTAESRTPPERTSRPAGSAGGAKPVQGPAFGATRPSKTSAATNHARGERSSMLAPVRSEGKRSRLIGRKQRSEMDAESATRSRHASVADGQTHVKAGLRPPPPAASALTRLRSPTSRAAREIKGWEPPSSHFPRSPPRGVKKAPRPIDKKAPIRARP
jgi:hypothetical protein